MASLSWREGLSKVGEYYEGFVKNVDDVLVKHQEKLALPQARKTKTLQ